ncbi:hypothetical protein DPEC_G00221430 [Dallia pectoralis]|uniref:Uncharacterized protein n=1 Tax=Dallia pectoralis TaxID=75939 RepID=A0ACC2G405_DALPE|nr:hypothetical protein DPEC_G00221430 [Dallia pectoralis]
MAQVGLEEKIPPLAGSWPYSGSPTFEEPPFSSLNAELADITGASVPEHSDGDVMQRPGRLLKVQPCGLPSVLCYIHTVTKPDDDDDARVT